MDRRLYICGKILLSILIFRVRDEKSNLTVYENSWFFFCEIAKCQNQGSMLPCFLAQDCIPDMASSKGRPMFHLSQVAQITPCLVFYCLLSCPCPTLTSILQTLPDFSPGLFLKFFFCFVTGITLLSQFV